MALNASIFPAFGAESLAPQFSDGPGAPGEGMAAYIAALDRLTDTRAWREASRRIVVAHSFGGMLGLSWLLAHGGTGDPPVHGLVLMSTTAGPMYDVARVRWGPFRIPAKPLMPLWNNGVVSYAAKLVFGGARTGEVDFQRYRNRSEIAVGIAGWRQTTVRGRRAYRFAMQGLDIRRRLEEIQVPTIVLHGTIDRYFRMALAEELAGGLGARLVRVDGARHTLPITHPGAVLEAVADLMAATAPSS